MLDARKMVNGYQVIRKSGCRLSGNQGVGYQDSRVSGKRKEGRRWQVVWFTACAGINQSKTLRGKNKNKKNAKFLSHFRIMT